MKEILKVILLLAASALHAQDKSPHIITFFFKPLTLKKNFDHEKMQRLFTQPGSVSQKMIKSNLTNPYDVNGIFSTYAGYFALSNTDGLVAFPRKNQKSVVRILVTQSIKPIFYPTASIPSKVVNYWVVSKTAAASYYILTLKQDPTTKLYYWSAEHRDLPESKKIPRDTIVIIADPKYVYVQTGDIMLSPSTPHFILPDIYVNPKLNRALSSLRFLKVKKYFSPITFEYKFDTKGYRQQLVRR